jgi:glycosyltransferase involved in cell wall biosynthesis
VIDPGRHGFVAALAARTGGRLTIVEVGDPQAALYRAQGRSAAAAAIGGAVDAAVARGASGIVYRGRELADTLKPHAPWLVLPDGVDVERFRPAPADEHRRRLGIPHNALVAGVVGTIAWSPVRRSAYGLDVIEALSRIPDAPVHALIVGGGDGLEHLRRRARELGVSDRVTLTGARPHDEIAGLLNAMDVCVSTQTNDAIGRGRTTAKLPEYLACDRYVLATSVGTAAEVLPQEMLLPFAAAVDDGHSQRLAEALTALIPRRTTLRAGAGTRRIALERFDYRILADRLSTFVHKICAR